MKTIDKQKLVTKSLFKKMHQSLWSANARTTDTLDIVAKDVVGRYVKNAEVSALTEEQKEDLAFYLQRSYIE